MNSLEKTNTYLEEIVQVNKICEMLMKTPYYKKMGAEGIFAIVQVANSIGVSPLQALNSGMYYINGHVELKPSLMSSLIRQKGHSITQIQSDNEICVLRGKRSDNGDEIEVSFSMEDAQMAGIVKNAWKTYPRDMLYNRALSRLGRRLFADVIDGCYIEGEISGEINKTVETTVEIDVISDDQYVELWKYLEPCEQLQFTIMEYMKKKWNIDDFKKMPSQLYAHSLIRAKEELAKLAFSDETVQDVG